MGGFTETGVRILRGKNNPYTPKNSIYCFSISSHRSFNFKFCPSSYQCNIPISKLSVRNKFYRSMKVHRHTNFLGRKCSDLGVVGGWLSCNLNVVRICKSARNIGPYIGVLIVNACYFAYSLLVCVFHCH